MEWYRDIFNRPIFLELYERGDTRAAVEEIDGLIKLLDLRTEQQILDLCCGYGRHATELAKRGFAVTGLDLSPMQINRAKGRAKEAKADVRFIIGDARNIPFNVKFDVVINMFLSFGYFETQEEDLKMLKEVARVTKRGGIFLMDQWNREGEIKSFQERTHEMYGDKIILKDREFDYIGGRLNWTNTVIFPDGKRESWYHSIRAYTIAELKGLLDRAGFAMEKVVGSFK